MKKAYWDENLQLTKQIKELEDALLSKMGEAIHWRGCLDDSRAKMDSISSYNKQLHNDLSEMQLHAKSLKTKLITACKAMENVASVDEVADMICMEHNAKCAYCDCHNDYNVTAKALHEKFIIVKRGE